MTRVHDPVKRTARLRPGEPQFSPWRGGTAAACSRRPSWHADLAPQRRSTMSRMKPEDVIAGKNRPFTGSEYLESLRDGREVYIYGARVDDVTKHPAFRNSARSIARLYDSLHDPRNKEVLTCATDCGGGSFTHKFFRVARSREDLIGQREAIAAWARMSYGWMGRTPDYKASLMNTLGVQHDFYERFADNAKRWYRRAQDHVLFMNHA